MTRFDRAARWGSLAVLVAAAGALTGCGYRAVYGGDAPERFHVVLARVTAADVTAGDEVVAGVRDVLAKEGALAPGEGYPRVEVELLRLDEVSEGITAENGRPRARAMDLGVVARGWVRFSPDGPEERDTGDVRAFDTVAATATGASGSLTASARSAVVTGLDARRATGRRVGRRIGLRVLGFPVPMDEGGGPER